MNALIRGRGALFALSFLVASPFVAVSAVPASGAVGDPILRGYLEPDPIGGAPLTDQYLQELVSAETGPFTTAHIATSGAAEGWSNSHTGAAMFDVLAGISGGIPKSKTTARNAAVGGCVGLGAKRADAHATHVRGTKNEYQVKCEVRSGSTTASVGVVVSVKANVICAIFGQLRPRYTLRKLDAFAIRQLRLLPASGVVVPAS